MYASSYVCVCVSSGTSSNCMIFYAPLVHPWFMQSDLVVPMAQTSNNAAQKLCCDQSIFCNEMLKQHKMLMQHKILLFYSASFPCAPRHRFSILVLCCQIESASDVFILKRHHTNFL